MDNIIKCWCCGYEYDEDEDILCPNCDADIDPDETCPKCGTEYGCDDDGCPNCGGMGIISTRRGTMKTKSSSREPYLAIKCSQCGGALFLNEVKTAGHCEHCGTKFVANPDIIKPTAKSKSISRSEVTIDNNRHIKPVIVDMERKEYKRFKNGINYQNAIDAALPRCPFCGRVARWEWHINGGKPGIEYRCGVCFSKIRAIYGFKKTASKWDLFFKNKPVKEVTVLNVNDENSNGFVIGMTYGIDEIGKSLFIEKQ